MAFTNRWVCVINLDNVSPEDILAKDGIIQQDWGEKFELSKVIKFDPPIKGKDEKGNEQIKYLSGKLYYQWEDDVIDFSIESEKIGEKTNVQLRETVQKIRRTSIVEFWMSFNKSRKYILFRNSKIGERGLRSLSTLLFGDPNIIKPAEFDIRQIEADVKAGVFEGMWAFHFKDRNGSITKGTLYADDIVDTEDDPMYTEAATAPKNFIGLIMEFNESERVKLRISKKGTVTIYKTIDPIEGLDTIFDTVDLFGDYIKE